MASFCNTDTITFSRSQNFYFLNQPPTHKEKENSFISKKVGVGRTCH